MVTPLESNFLIPNASLLLALLVLLLLVGVVVGGLVWLVVTLSNRSRPSER